MIQVMYLWSHDKGDPSFTKLYTWSVDDDTLHVDLNFSKFVNRLIIAGSHIFSSVRIRTFS